MTDPSQPAATAAAPPAAAPKPAPEPPVLVKDAGFAAPESVLYDAEQDLYLVSNINGKPDEADKNGFISKLGPDGKVIELKWIDGTRKDSTLNAPKGMAIANGTLYVADLTFVRLFDRKTGAPKGKIAAPGSTFLNGVAAAPDGTVYVTDSGIKSGKDGFDPTGTDAIYKIGKNGRADKLVASTDLGRPNGILADDKGLSVVTFGTGALYRVGLDGKKEADQKLPSAALDGIVQLPDGSLLVSSWGASSVFRGTANGTFAAALTDLKSPAGIGFDSKRGVVLVPQLQLDTVALAKLPGGMPAPAAGAAPAAAPAAAPGGARPAATPATPAAPAKGAATPATPAAPAKAVAPAAPATPPAGQKSSPPPAAAPAAPATPAAPKSAPPAPARAPLEK